jgi:hypothetical protein
MNKFSGKQTRFSEGALSLVVCQALGTSCQNNGYSPLAHRRKTYMRVTFLMEVNYL